MDDKSWENYCLSRIPALRKRWNYLMRSDLDLENPKRLTEKIQWLKIYDSNQLKTICSDKIKVREFCNLVLGKDYFIPIIGIWNSFDEIDFDKLPREFVLKTNHGSHTNCIIRDTNINRLQLKRLFDNWMSTDWSWYGEELAYKRIEKKIFAETFMSDGNRDLIDYKFLCFNGVPKFCQVIGNRNEYSKHLNYYDMDFVPCSNISRNDFPANYNIEHKAPKSFDMMKDIASTLSKAFNFVRVDFYEIDGRPYLGELTFFPGAGYFTYRDPETDMILGNMLKL